MVQRFPSRLTEQLAHTVAPLWKTFRDIDLEGSARKLGVDDVYVAETSAEEEFLFHSVALVLRSLGRTVGVIFRNPDRYDPSSLRFCRRILQEARHSQFAVAIDGSFTLSREGPLAELLKDCEHVPDIATPSNGMYNTPPDILAAWGDSLIVRMGAVARPRWFFTERGDGCFSMQFQREPAK